MHIGIILKLTRHEPIRNSWNVIRILNVAQMSYQIEAPIGHVSFWKSRIIHQNFHRFSNPKIGCLDVFPSKKLAWKHGISDLFLATKRHPKLAACTKTSGHVNHPPEGWGHWEGCFWFHFLRWISWDDWKQSFGDQNDHSKSK